MSSSSGAIPKGSVSVCVLEGAWESLGGPGFLAAMSSPIGRKHGIHDGGPGCDALLQGPPSYVRRNRFFGGSRAGKN